MTLLGDVLKKVTAAAAELGEAVVDGLGDLTESITGENQVTKAARTAGMTLVRGAKDVADATIDVGEAMFETVFGSAGTSERDGEQQRGRNGPQAPDFVEPVGG